MSPRQDATAAMLLHEILQGKRVVIVLEGIAAAKPRNTRLRCRAPGCRRMLKKRQGAVCGTPCGEKYLSALLDGVRALFDAGVSVDRTKR